MNSVHFYFRSNRNGIFKKTTILINFIFNFAKSVQVWMGRIALKGIKASGASVPK